MVLNDGDGTKLLLRRMILDVCPNTTDATPTRRRWLIFAVDGQLPLDDDGWLIVEHAPSCTDPDGNLCCNPSTCRAQVGLFTPGPSTPSEIGHVSDGLFRILQQLDITDAELPTTSGSELAESVETAIWFYVYTAPEDSSRQHPVPDAVDLPRDYVEGLRIVTNRYLPSLTQERLWPFYIEAVDAGEQEPATFRVNINPFAPDPGRPRPVAPHDLSAARTIAVWSALDDPTVRFLELAIGTQHDAHLLGDYMGAIVKAAVGAEILVSHVAWMTIWEDARRRLNSKLRKSSAADLLTVLMDQYVGPNRSNSLVFRAQILREKVARVRNRIVHDGYRPTPADADDAVRAFLAFYQVLVEQVAARWAQRPWTALKWSTMKLTASGDIGDAQRILLERDGSGATLEQVHVSLLDEYHQAIR